LNIVSAIDSPRANQCQMTWLIAPVTFQQAVANYIQL